MPNDRQSKSGSIVGTFLSILFPQLFLEGLDIGFANFLHLSDIGKKIRLGRQNIDGVCGRLKAGSLVSPPDLK